MNSPHKSPPDIVIREFRMENYDKVITLWDDTRLPYRPKGLCNLYPQRRGHTLYGFSILG